MWRANSLAQRRACASGTRPCSWRCGTRELGGGRIVSLFFCKLPKLLLLFSFCLLCVSFALFLYTLQIFGFFKAFFLSFCFSVYLVMCVQLSPFAVIFHLSSFYFCYFLCFHVSTLLNFPFYFTFCCRVILYSAFRLRLFVQLFQRPGRVANGVGHCGCAGALRAVVGDYHRRECCDR